MGLLRLPLRLLPPDGRMGWTPFAWLIYLLTFFVAPIIDSTTGQAAWWLWPLTIAASLLFLVTYFVGYWVRGRRRVAIAAVHLALGIAFAPINPGSCVFFVYAASFLGMLDRPRDAARGLFAVAALGAATSLLVDVPLFFALVAVVIALMVGGVNLHYAQQSRADDRLRLAHEEIEQLAAIAERERIARDLHDVLGHTLSMVVLKSELAAKLAAIDPERAASEMRDVEHVARRTLHDVRLAIRGYRTTLPEELDRARSMLKAARIAGRITGVADPLPQHVEETLALVLREAVTNVVRHSGASHCTITVRADPDAVVLEVRDDGRGFAGGTGLGLRGIRERVESLEGSVVIEGGAGTTLLVTLPAPPASGSGAPPRVVASATTPITAP